jgi:hypothetical protein
MVNLDINPAEESGIYLQIPQERRYAADEFAHTGKLVVPCFSGRTHLSPQRSPAYPGSASNLAGRKEGEWGQA